MSDAEIKLFLTQLLWSAIVPAGVAFLVLFLCGRSESLKKSSWPVVLAICLGFALSYGAIVGFQFPPAERLHWLPCPFLGGLLLFTLEGTLKLPSPIRALLKLATLGTFLWPLLQPLKPRYSDFEISAWLAGLGIASLLLWHLYDRASLQVDSSKSLTVLFVVAGGSAVTCLLSGSVKIAELLGALSCALGVCLVFRLWKKQFPFGRAAFPVVFLPLMFLIFHTRFYVDLTIPSAILLLVSMAGILLAPMKFFASRKGVKGLIVLAAAVAIPCIAAAALSLGTRF